MKPRLLLGHATTPEGGEMALYHRDGVYLLQVDGHDLMSSRARGSEEALGRLAVAALDDRPAPRVLVGGLGMGFTLRATLDALADRPGATVVVAEVIEAVVEWNRGPLGPLAGNPLADPRVEVAIGDVAALLERPPEPWDAVLLDVDNGPEALTLRANHHLYTRRGLERLHDALSPGGIVAVWSAGTDYAFPDLLRAQGFTAWTHRVTSRSGGKGDKHVLFVGRRG